MVERAFGVGRAASRERDADENELLVTVDVEIAAVKPQRPGLVLGDDLKPVAFGNIELLHHRLVNRIRDRVELLPLAAFE
jgi:hypothetical protein